jgi:hypothetical protein
MVKGLGIVFRSRGFKLQLCPTPRATDGTAHAACQTVRSGHAGWLLV